MLGGHGDTMVPLSRYSTVAGHPDHGAPAAGPDRGARGSDRERRRRGRGAAEDGLRVLCPGRLDVRDGRLDPARPHAGSCRARSSSRASTGSTGCSWASRSSWAPAACSASSRSRSPPTSRRPSSKSAAAVQELVDKLRPSRRHVAAGRAAARTLAAVPLAVITFAFDPVLRLSDTSSVRYETVRSRSSSCSASCWQSGSAPGRRPSSARMPAPASRSTTSCSSASATVPGRDHRRPPGLRPRPPRLLRREPGGDLRRGPGRAHAGARPFPSGSSRASSSRACSAHRSAGGCTSQRSRCCSSWQRGKIAGPRRDGPGRRAATCPGRRPTRGPGPWGPWPPTLPAHPSQLYEAD